MGLEATCEARIGRQRSQGKAQLEGDALIFRGEFRAKVPLASIRDASARDGVLTVKHADGTLALGLGAAAAKWADRIKNPRSVMDKLGVKSGQRVVILGVTDDQLAKDLAARGAEVSAGRMKPGADVVFLGAERASALSRLPPLERAIVRNGAIWVLWPKGRADLNEDSVRAAALKAGLVDVKVVRFSETHGALKLVIPLKRR
jgi:hypothetical protein